MYHGAHEDEAAHKLETQSLARRCESRYKTSDWLDTLPIEWIQRSKSKPCQQKQRRKRENEEEEGKDDQEEQHLSMITISQRHGRLRVS